MTTEPDLFDKLQEIKERVEKARKREARIAEELDHAILLVEALQLLRVGSFHPARHGDVQACKERIRRRLGVIAA